MTPIQLEVKKHKLSQNTDGTWQLTLTTNAEDMNKNPVFLQARMGTRYLCVLVELTDDDEESAHRKAETTARHLVGTQEKTAENLAAQDVPKFGRPPERWEEMSLAKQAGIRCGSARFWKFLIDVYGYDVTDTETAAEAVRTHCGYNVTSRAQFDTYEDLGNAWKSLDAEYQEYAGQVAEQRG
jgi:hypothetical protein